MEDSLSQEERGNVGSSVQHIWLVRHGLTQWNTEQRYCGHSDTPLSTTGRAQANWLAHQLRSIPLKMIYSSDLVRARETAEIIAMKRIQPVEVVISPEWREINFGDWEGYTYADIVTAFKDQLGFFADPEFCAPPNGESLTDVLFRVKNALSELLYNHQSPEEGDIVIVSHGGPLRGLLCHLLGMPLSHQWQLSINPGSLSAIDISMNEGGSLLASLTLLNFQRSRSSTDSNQNAQTQPFRALLNPETKEESIQDV